MNRSPCSSNIQLVYRLPRLSKYLPFFSCESKIPVHNFSLLLAQISETTEN